MQLPPDADPPTPLEADKPATAPRKATATQFFLKGLAISLPPILTLVIVVWIAQIVYGYVVGPITTGVRFVIAEIVDKSQPTSNFVRATGLPALEYCNNDYRLPEPIAKELRARLDQARKGLSPLADREQGESSLQYELAENAYVPFGEWAVPYRDFKEVAAKLRPTDWPATVSGLYMELVTIRYFKSLGSLSALTVALTIAGLYFLGRFVTARMGQWLVTRFEVLVLARLPVVNSVYSSVKQVTDFFFSERPVAYNRVVAFEFPRKGVWSIGFAMGESFLEMTLAAGEPMISVMIPAAPMPMTGWVISVPKSSVIDLNVTLDQAFQYCLSCGVLIPEHQRATPELLHREFARRLAATFNAPRDGSAAIPPNLAVASSPFPGATPFAPGTPPFDVTRRTLSPESIAPPPEGQGPA